MYRSGGWLLCSARVPVQQVAFLEVWEKFKKLSSSSEAEAVTIRLQCPETTAHKLNATVNMRYVTTQFLAREESLATGSVPEKGWWTGDFSVTDNYNRRRLLEDLTVDGWRLLSSSQTISERQWILSSFVLVSEVRKP